MPKKWKTYKLSEVTEYIGRGISPKYTEEEDSIRVLNQRCIRDNKIIFETCRNHDINKKGVSEVKFVKQYDVLVNSTGVGTLGRVAQFKENLDKITVDSHVSIVRPIAEFAEKFFGYAVIQNQPKIESLGIGSTGQTELSRTRLGEEIIVNIPESKIEREAIANILSAIDDKIENNLAINKTLEDMAMALYKHWFVDFGPFQDGEFIDSELGLIPEGWEVKPFLDMFELLSGGTPKTSVQEYWSGQFNWVSAKDIGSSGSIYINDTEKKITQLGIDKSATKILPEDTVIVVARGSVGKFGMITKPMCMNQSCYGIYSKSNYSQPITYLLIESLMKHFLNVAYGSVFDTITTSTFKSINVLEPSKKVMDKVKGEIDVLFQNKKTNINEIQTLTKLRNTLLPKLISGEVRLKAFREQVETVLQ